MTEPCLFCRIVRHEIPVALVAETDDCISFRDIDPQAPFHVLVLPKGHVSSMNEADQGLLGSMSKLAAQIAASEGYTETGYRTVINTNRDGGQTVFHLHLHLLAGRQMHWPPG